MDITKLPFNAHVGIDRSSKDGTLLVLNQKDHHGNHLGTVHASALFALAEATSGEFLLQSRGSRTEIGGVVRKASSKYSKPALGKIFSRVKTSPNEVDTAIETVDARGRAMLIIEVELIDDAEQVVASFDFTWLLAVDTAEA